MVASLIIVVLAILVALGLSLWPRTANSRTMQRLEVAHERFHLRVIIPLLVASIYAVHFLL